MGVHRGGIAVHTWRSRGAPCPVPVCVAAAVAVQGLCRGQVPRPDYRGDRRSPRLGGRP